MNHRQNPLQLVQTPVITVLQQSLKNCEMQLCFCTTFAIASLSQVQNTQFSHTISLLSMYFRTVQTKLEWTVTACYYFNFLSTNLLITLLAYYSS